NGIDVVNMSVTLDPWLWDCPSNPADTSEEQSQQLAEILAVQRAVDYARARGTVSVAIAQNGFTGRGVDLGHPDLVDELSPDLPAGAAHPRTIDNSCLLVPAETNHVITVAGFGPSGRKAFYSNYGLEQTDISAP